MELGIKGKVALVTGASKGIGAASAMMLAQEGATVAINARTRADLDAKADEIRKRTRSTVYSIPGDLSKPGEADRVVAEVVKQAGRLDILVNNAGSAPGGVIEELSEEQWQQGLQLKLMGHVRCMTAALPIMVKQGGGRIVNVVGNDGVKTAYWEIVPAACNAADLILTQALAEQYGPHGIYINALNPGPVYTERMETLLSHWAKSEGITLKQAIDVHAASIPLKRICESDEVAKVVLFLASDMASFVTGTYINVDGGQRKATMDVLLNEVKRSGKV